MNICEHLARPARLVPESVAIAFEGTTISYATLDDRAAAAADVLRTAGIAPGDRVAMMLGNVPAFAVWYFAIQRVGAIGVSLSSRFQGTEVAPLLADCSARLLITDAEIKARITADLPDCVESVHVASDDGSRFDNAPLPAAVTTDWYDAEPDEPAVILYTSGTTGYSKGATLSHRNVCSNVAAFNHLCDQRADDRILLAVPLFHCFGQNALLNSGLAAGATLVLLRQFTPPAAIEAIGSQGVTQLYGVPAMFQLLHDLASPDQLSSVRYCFSAAATLPVQVGQAWHDRFGLPIHEGYGLTETSPFASYNHRLAFTPGTIGTAIDGCEMRIVDTDTGQPVEPGQLGEIVIRGPNVMLGYWNRPDDTAAAMIDGWFRSGDIGRQDERGFFHIVDRAKDMIAVGGLKVYPAEVERVLLDHDAAEQIAIVGRQDDVFGEHVVAFVVLADGVTDAAESLRSIVGFAAERLAGYKRPRQLVAIEALPRNPSGKVLKRELRDLDYGDAVRIDAVDIARSTDEPAASSAHTPVLAPQLATAHAGQHRRLAERFLIRLVGDMIAANMPGQTTAPLTAESKLLETGLDSLSIAEIALALQAETGQPVPATIVFNYPRVTDLAGYLVETITADDVTQERQQPVPTNRLPVVPSDAVSTDIDAMTDDDAMAALLRELED